MLELDRIYNMDCLHGMKEIPDKSIDLVLTDPPYNVGKDYGNNFNDSKSRQEFIDWMKPRFIEMKRISKTIIISGQGRLADYALIEPWKWLLAWWKPSAMGRSPVGFCNWEPLAMWGKGCNNGVDIIKAVIKPDKKLDGHPCPKPLGWAEEIIKLFKDANVVCDPFIGSGTTAIACKKLNRHYIGFEINPEYCDIAEKRLLNIPERLETFSLK